MYKGELVYIPAETLLQKKDENGVTLTLLRIERPINLIVTEVQEKECQVLYENAHWWVSRKNTYGVKQ